MEALQLYETIVRASPSVILSPGGAGSVRDWLRTGKSGESSLALKSMLEDRVA